MRVRGGARLALAIALLMSGPAAAPAGAAITKLEFRPAPADVAKPADLRPIAPGDAAWNEPDPAAPYDVKGNTFKRPGDPVATTQDYVEYFRSVPDGREDGVPLRGDLIYDPETVKPGLPAIILIHGGMVRSEVCTPGRRWSNWLWSQEFTRRGYIVFQADFPRPKNDRAKGLVGYLFAPRYRGDCAADDGWEPGAKRAQVSLQLAVRSFKQQLANFAADHPADPAAPAFRAASDKVVSFGISSGGHLATRLALRSEEPSNAPGDSAATWLSRRVAGAVGIASIGDCTPSNPLRNFSKLYAIPAFPPPAARPFASCGPLAPDAHDSPVRFFNGTIALKGWAGRYFRMPSPFSGAPGWGSNIGWDGVVDARWPKRTCEDLNAFKPGSCIAKTYPVASLRPHYLFPDDARPPGAPETAPTYWQSSVAAEVDAFFRAARSDAEIAAEAH